MEDALLNRELAVAFGYTTASAHTPAGAALLAVGPPDTVVGDASARTSAWSPQRDATLELRCTDPRTFAKLRSPKSAFRIRVTWRMSNRQRHGDTAGDRCAAAGC